MASRCTIALVDPPVAASATMALWNEAIVNTALGRRPASTISTASRPALWECSSRPLSGAGVPAMPGIVIPSASAMTAIVEAVPIVLQWPLLRIIDFSDSRRSASVISAARTSSHEAPHVGTAAQRSARGSGR